jgi:hypothetical protein
MSRDLLIGLISLAAALVLLFLGLPNRREESPPLLRFYAAPMIYPAIILIFLGMGGRGVDHLGHAIFLTTSDARTA